MRKVEVTPYNKTWHLKFVEEANKLRGIFGSEIINIHHIGSTSVEGLKAKPVIDIMLVVKNIDRVDDFNNTMIDIGYEPKGENGIPRRRYFKKGGDDRTHHVHTYGLGHSEIERHLLFRDYLRSHPDVVKEYGNLKEALSQRFPNNIRAYIRGKEQLVLEIDKKAMAWSMGQEILNEPLLSGETEGTSKELKENGDKERLGMTTKYVNWGKAKVKLTWKPDKQLPPRKRITSVHGCCFKGNKLLLVNLNHRGWDFPGGHIENGETPGECIKREAYEEGYVTGSCSLLGHIIVDHNENPHWDESSPYPKVGYQVFYRMDIDQLHNFTSNYESKERILINPNEVKEYYHEWNELYQEILEYALRK